MTCSQGLGRIVQGTAPQCGSLMAGTLHTKSPHTLLQHGAPGSRFLWPAWRSRQHHSHPHPWRWPLCAPRGGLQSPATTAGTRNQPCSAGVVAAEGLSSELRLAIASVGLCQRSDPVSELCPVLPRPCGSGQGGGTGGVGVTCLHVAAASPGVPETGPDTAPGSLKCWI